MTWVKVCGLSRPEDVEAAAQAGADAIGFVFYSDSPRLVTVDQARDLGSDFAGLATRAVRDGDDSGHHSLEKSMTIQDA